MMMLYEKEEDTENVGRFSLCNNPSIWRYVDRISIEKFKKKIETGDDSFPILKLFFREVCEVFINILILYC